jgi:PAS domain S-box-containing protein
VTCIIQPRTLPFQAYLEQTLSIYVDTDYRIIQPDGNVHWIRSRNFPIVDKTGKTFRVAGVAEDITDLKSADLSLKAAKEYAETLIQTANAMIIGLDQHGTITLFNEAAEGITGYTAAELAGRNWFEVIVPKVQYPRVWEEFNRLLAGGLPKYFENPILTKSGEERYIVWKNSEIRNNEQTVGTISFGIDITERKRAEDALRVSEEKFRLISESSPDHIVIQDRDLRYIWILNPQLGLTPEDMIGKTDYDILTKEDADQLTLVKRQVLETGKTIHYETSLSSSLGETEYFEGVYLPKYDNDGQIDGLMGYFRNITERKQAEQTIRHALAEKEVLLREVHHRVKNNLAGILALIELQISSLSDPQQIAQFKDLEKRIRSMALVHDSLSRTKDLARINVASYTENLTSHLLPAYGTEGKVRCRIEMGDITLPIETATPCGLVMTEIVTNSLKYAFPKTFSCEEIRGEPCTISLTLHRDGNDYLLGIADNGIGMPEGIDVTKPHTLGRFLIRFIVEHQLGGSIEISTARGTAYMIRFPAPAVTEGNTYEKM